MKNLNRIPLLVGITLMMMFTSSCLSDEDSTPRTEQQELYNLNNLIQTLISNGHQVDTTASGVYYIVHEEGEGPLIQPGDTIDIAYEGYLSEGNLFDETESIEIIYKEEPLISGFEDGLALMNKNCEIELIIPSSMAYGAYGSPPAIPPYATLIFGIKVNEIRPKVE